MPRYSVVCRLPAARTVRHCPTQQHTRPHGGPSTVPHRSNRRHEIGPAHATDGVRQCAPSLPPNSPACAAVRGGVCASPPPPNKKESSGSGRGPDADHATECDRMQQNA
eukprot:gene8295-biopygen22619